MLFSTNILYFYNNELGKKQTDLSVIINCLLNFTSDSTVLCLYLFLNKFNYLIVVSLRINNTFFLFF